MTTKAWKIIQHAELIIHCALILFLDEEIPESLKASSKICNIKVAACNMQIIETIINKLTRRPACFSVYMFFKRLSFGSKEYTKELKVWSVQVFWGRLVFSAFLCVINLNLLLRQRRTKTNNPESTNTKKVCGGDF